MIFIRKANERGKTSTNWLQSWHTFSFGEYYDPGFMGFGSLRVINEDTVQPGQGFGRHAHEDMEIISYVIDGALEHKDSLGTGSIIKPGEIQRMSAGTGVEHSEFNHSKDELVHFLQIWIIPDKQGIEPQYEQKSIAKVDNKLILIGSPDGREGSVTINQDVLLYAVYLSADQRFEHAINEKRGLWVQVVKGNVSVNGEELAVGDGAAIFDEEKILAQALSEAECLMFDLKIVE